MIPSRLSLVTIGARDVPALRDFYERLWGASSSAPGDDFAHFELGGAHLGIYRMDLLAEEAKAELPPADGRFAGFTLAINLESGEAVDEAMAKVREAGGTIVAEPVDRDWGGRSAYFADPEGNVWEPAWVPGSSFDERGALIWPSS